ncbi:hypothetical protein CYMTET_17350 [Cymbomonas tetramitiformis]|uniref:Methyltransferase domain-containing protein n=1 Tax=Cymbomonas tetramitiformis TaxID=36881 RepID=A0AAE0GAK1_9CHLO|nr:hypothetical protein CYMTET_17350 [Cymbomonas tetramitiformis]
MFPHLESVPQKQLESTGDGRVEDDNVEQLKGYRKKWDGVYSNDLDIEWHCSFEQVRDLLEPYLQQATVDAGTEGEGHGKVLLDVGCGSSSFAEEIMRIGGYASRFQEVVLTDISSVILERLKSNWCERQSAADAARRFVVCDCRNFVEKEVPEGSVDVVIDKGTLDAMDSEADKAATFRECVRSLRRAPAPEGSSSTACFVSISFPAVARLHFLQAMAAAAEFHDLIESPHIHVVGDKDPAYGGRVVFVSIFQVKHGRPGRESVNQASPGTSQCPVPYCPSALTTTVLARAQKSQSIINEPDDEDDANIMGALFDE